MEDKRNIPPEFSPFLGYINIKLFLIIKMENGNDPNHNPHYIDNQLATNQLESATLNPAVMQYNQASNKFDYPSEEYK